MNTMKNEILKTKAFFLKKGSTDTDVNAKVLVLLLCGQTIQCVFGYSCFFSLPCVHVWVVCLRAYTCMCACMLYVCVSKVGYEVASSSFNSLVHFPVCVGLKQWLVTFEISLSHTNTHIVSLSQFFIESTKYVSC